MSFVVGTCRCEFCTARATSVSSATWYGLFGIASSRSTSWEIKKHAFKQSECLYIRLSCRCLRLVRIV